MQLIHGKCQVAPGPRHGAPFGCSVTRPYEITHPSRAFRDVLDCHLVKSIGFFHICMVLLRATRRGPSRDRRTRIIHSVKKQRFRSPCAGPKCVLMTSTIRYATAITSCPRKIVSCSGIMWIGGVNSGAPVSCGESEKRMSSIRSIWV